MVKIFVFIFHFYELNNLGTEGFYLPSTNILQKIKGQHISPLFLARLWKLVAVNKVYKKQLLEFSLRIKELRKNIGLTQVNLAAEMDVDVRTIKNLESGKYNPTLIIILSLSQALKVNPSELFRIN